ncbi:hypothetical protein PFISCL1PPCAC_1166, partial [Pristionchus fissidentatus]
MTVQFRASTHACRTLSSSSTLRSLADGRSSLARLRFLHLTHFHFRWFLSAHTLLARQQIQFVRQIILIILILLIVSFPLLLSILPLPSTIVAHLQTNHLLGIHGCQLLVLFHHLLCEFIFDNANLLPLCQISLVSFISQSQLLRILIVLQTFNRLLLPLLHLAHSQFLLDPIERLVAIDLFLSAEFIQYSMDCQIIGSARVTHSIDQTTDIEQLLLLDSSVHDGLLINLTFRSRMSSRVFSLCHTRYAALKYCKTV